MAWRTVAEAARAMRGRVVAGDGAAPWRAATLDSRRVTGGELFFALPGEHTDGHRFVGAALEAGAAAVVVERDVEAPAAGAVIRVGRVYEALHALTRAARERVPRRLVGITGSTGKTTTKELLAALLGRRFRVAKNPGNFNNLLGFPVSLLSIPEDTEWMVAEMGMSSPGELGAVSRLGRPDAAVFTNVRPVHLEGLGSLEAIARAKAELLEGLAAGGLVVANAADPWVCRIVAGEMGVAHSGRVVTYALDGEAEFVARDLEPLASGVGTRFRLVASGGETAIELPLHGRYNVENFLAAAACAASLEVPLDEIAAAAREVAPAAGRGVVRPLAAGATLVDDSYNSNPVALQRALESAKALPGRRHWAVLGDLLELGEEQARYHREAGEGAAELGFAPVYAVGELSRELAAGVEAAGGEARWFATAEEAAEAARGELREGDVVLVKGSRGVHLERVVAALDRGEG